MCLLLSVVFQLLDIPQPETSQPTLGVLEPLTTGAASLRLLESWAVPRAALPGPGESGGELGGQDKGTGRVTRQTRSSAVGVARSALQIATEAAERHLAKKEWLANQQGSTTATHPPISRSYPLCHCLP